MQNKLFRCSIFASSATDLSLCCVFQVQVVQEALDKANITERDLSAIAVTIGPGLSLCLRGNMICINSYFLHLCQLY